MDYPDKQDPAGDWLVPKDAGSMVKVKPQTLANWRSLGKGPPYSKLTPGPGGRVRYNRLELERWLSGQEVSAE